MKIKLRLSANVVETNGQVSLSYRNPSYYQDQLNQLKGKKKAFVTIETGGSSRSLQQNRYLWSVIYPILAETTGYSDEEVHEWAKSALLPPKILKVGTKAVYTARSTTSLTVGEMVEYIDKLIELAENLGCVVPTLEQAGYISNYPEHRVAKTTNRVNLNV